MPVEGRSSRTSTSLDRGHELPQCRHDPVVRHTGRRGLNRRYCSLESARSDKSESSLSSSRRSSRCTTSITNSSNGCAAAATRPRRRQRPNRWPPLPLGPLVLLLLLASAPWQSCRRNSITPWLATAQETTSSFSARQSWSLGLSDSNEVDVAVAGGGGLRLGNGIVAIPSSVGSSSNSSNDTDTSSSNNNPLLLAVTTQSGTLYIVDATSQTTVASYTPQSSSETDTTMSCTSSVVIVPMSKVKRGKEKEAVVDVIEQSTETPTRTRMRQRQQRRQLQEFNEQRKKDEQGENQQEQQPGQANEENDQQPQQQPNQEDANVDQQPETTTTAPSEPPVEPATTEEPVVADERVENGSDNDIVLVYAVVDSSATTSQVLALTLNGTLAWSVTLDGTIVGTPVYSSLHHVLYVVHNVPAVSDETNSLETTVDTSTQLLHGRVSVLQLPDSSSDASAESGLSIVATLPDVSTGRPFGPPSTVFEIATTTDRSNDNRNEDATTTTNAIPTDLILLADATTTDPYGALFVVQGSKSDGSDVVDYTFSIGSTAIGPTQTAPVVGLSQIDNQHYVYLGQDEATVIAWNTGDAEKLWNGEFASQNPGVNDNGDESIFWGAPTWGWNVQTNADDTNAPLPVSPTVSTDGRQLFIASAGWQVSSFPLDDSHTGWIAADGRSVTLARPVYHNGVVTTTPNAAEDIAAVPVVYFIESQGGVVRRYDADSGNLEWTLDCGTSADVACPNVEADFALSPDGSMLYYGDVDGNLVALQVAETSPYTLGPTSAPTAMSDAPSSNPSSAPVAAKVAAAPAPSTTTNAPRTKTTTAPSMAPSAAELTSFPTAGPEPKAPVATARQPVAAPTLRNATTGGSSNGSAQEESSTSSSREGIFAARGHEHMLIYALSGVCGALFILIGLVLFVLRRRTRKHKRRERMLQENSIKNPTIEVGSYDVEDNSGYRGSRTSVKLPAATTPMPSKSANKQAPSTASTDESFANSSLHKRTTPLSLQSIAESPSADDDQLSVGFEVGMDKSVVESSEQPETTVVVRDLNTAFARVDSTPAQVDATTSNTKATATATVASGQNHLLDDTVDEENYSSNSGGSRSVDGQLSVDSNDSASFLTRGMLAMASAVGVISQQQHHRDEKKDDFEDDDEDSMGPKSYIADKTLNASPARAADVNPTDEAADPVIVSRALSGDQKSIRSVTSSGAPQLLAQSPSGEQMIAWRSESMDHSIDGSSTDKKISRFTATTELQQPSISPLPSPTILYPAMMAGSKSALDITSSPLSLQGSVVSLDGSLYMDEQTIASLEMPLSDSAPTKAHSTAAVVASSELVAMPIGNLPSDCPEDEVINKLQPGASYLNRHKAKKEQALNDRALGSSTTPTVQRPLVRSSSETRGISTNRTTLPMYKGVSVRPASRSRAGIFSRRQAKPASDEDSDNGPESSSPIGSTNTPEVTPEPNKRFGSGSVGSTGIPSTPAPETENALSRSRTPTTYLTHSLRPPPSPTTPPRFTTAGFYVEEEPITVASAAAGDTDDGRSTDEEEESNFSVESSKHQMPNTKPVTYDPWGSFLTELSKVETQFFNPATKNENGKVTNRGGVVNNAASNSTRIRSRSLLKGRPPAPPPLPPADIESDNDADDTIPPPPRTFYA